MTKEDKNIILKGVKFRLYPTYEQELAFLKSFDNTTFVWNQMLEMMNTRYQNNPSLPRLRQFRLANLLPLLKQEYPFLKSSDSTSFTLVTKDLDLAWTRFFQDKTHKTGKPRFHSRFNHSKSFRGNVVNNSTRLEDKQRYIKIPKIGNIKYRSSPITIANTKEAKIKQYAIILSSDGKYYISLQVEAPAPKKLPISNRTIGISLGIRELAVLSNGKVYKKFSDPKLEAKIKEWSSKYSRRKYRAQIQIAIDKNKQVPVPRTLDDFKNVEAARKMKAHYQAKLANKRKDYLHKISTEIIRNYDEIYLGDSSIKGMQVKKAPTKKKNNINYSLANQALYVFKNQLSYKAAWYGKKYSEVDAKDSSKTCFHCRQKNFAFDTMPLSKFLSLKEWTCPNCGAINNRRVNAAKNLVVAGKKKEKTN